MRWLLELGSQGSSTQRRWSLSAGPCAALALWGVPARHWRSARRASLVAPPRQRARATGIPPHGVGRTWWRCRKRLDTRIRALILRWLLIHGPCEHLVRMLFFSSLSDFPPRLQAKDVDTSLLACVGHGAREDDQAAVAPDQHSEAQRNLGAWVMRATR